MEATPEQAAEGVAIIRVLSSVLDRLVTANVHIARTDPGQITKFHAMKAPGITIQQYLERIHKYACCSNECFILALIYIDRLIQRNNFLLTDLNVHRVLITAILLAAKFFDDSYYNNSYYAKVGGVLVNEMNGLEVDFLFRISFSLMVTPDIFLQYRAELLSHAAIMSVPAAAAIISSPQPISVEHSSQNQPHLTSMYQEAPPQPPPPARSLHHYDHPSSLYPAKETSPAHLVVNACSGPAPIYHHYQDPSATMDGLLRGVAQKITTSPPQDVVPLIVVDHRVHPSLRHLQQQQQHLEMPIESPHGYGNNNNMNYSTVDMSAVIMQQQAQPLRGHPILAAPPPVALAVGAPPPQVFYSKTTTLPGCSHPAAAVGPPGMMGPSPSASSSSSSSSSSEEDAYAATVVMSHHHVMFPLHHRHHHRNVHQDPGFVVVRSDGPASCMLTGVSGV